MKHWKLRAIFREPEHQRVIGYGEPITVPEKLGRKMLMKDRGGWDVMETDANVPDAMGARSTGPMTGVATLTQDGEKYAATLPQQIAKEKTALGADVEWEQLGPAGAPVPIAQARAAAKAKGE